MSFYFPNVDPIYIFKRKGTVEDPFLFLEETVLIINGKVVLKEIPFINNKVKAKINGVPLVEVDANSVSLSENEYKVDYSQGIVFFHNSLEDETVNLEYYGMGYVSVPAHRIWIENTNEEIETLQELTVNARMSGEYAKEQGERAESIADALNDIKYINTFDSSVSYEKNNIVTYDGNSYIAKQSTKGNIPSEESNNPYWGLVGKKGRDGVGSVSIKTETFIATEGQKVFKLPFSYQPLENKVKVIVGGVYQSKNNFEETNNTTITLSEGVSSGITVIIEVFSTEFDDRIAEYDEKMSELDIVINDVNTAVSESNTATQSANEAANYANQAKQYVDEYEANVYDYIQIPKEKVSTYSQLSNTYPNPDNGWVVFVDDEKVMYRYNGNQWMALYTQQQGGNMVVSNTAPMDSGALWIDLNE